MHFRYIKIKNIHIFVNIAIDYSSHLVYTQWDSP